MYRGASEIEREASEIEIALLGYGLEFGRKGGRKEGGGVRSTGYAEWGMAVGPDHGVAKPLNKASSR